MTHELSVPAALSGKRILLTGATGFLAKVVLEKLIRTVPDLKGVILLVRGGEAGNARERFRRQIATSSIFDPLRAERGPWLERFFDERLECLTGEVTQDCFGLGAGRFEELAARTDLVINAAASVNFREPLDQALDINTLSLRQLTALARAAGAPLVQVSTCYVNGYRRGDILEDSAVPAGRAAIERDGEGQHDIGDLAGRLRRRIEAVRPATPIRRCWTGN